MKERELQQAIVECAQLRGWLVYHTFDSRRSAQGFPDLVLVRAGRIVFAELKVGKGKRSLDQLEWAVRLQAVEEDARVVGGLRPVVSYFEWRENDWLSGAVDRELQG